MARPTLKEVSDALKTNETLLRISCTCGWVAFEGRTALQSRANAHFDYDDVEVFEQVTIVPIPWIPVEQRR